MVFRLINNNIWKGIMKSHKISSQVMTFSSDIDKFALFNHGK